METPWIRGNRGGAAYLNISLPTFKRLLQEYPVKRVKMPTGAVLYRKDWLDSMLLQWTEESCRLDRLVNEVVKGVI